MRRITFWLIAALFTFIIGVIASILWIQSHSSNEVTPVKTGKNDSRRVFINQDLKWKTEKDADLESNNSFRYSENAILLVFYPDGQFASINCLIQQADETLKMQLIPNNGFGVRKGTWKLNGDDIITITSRLTSSNKLRDDAVVERQKARVERLVIRKATADRLATELELNGTIFIPAPNIEGVDELLSMPNDNL
jgi:hypothetical protein